MVIETVDEDNISAIRGRALTSRGIFFNNFVELYTTCYINKLFFVELFHKQPKDVIK